MESKKKNINFGSSKKLPKNLETNIDQKKKKRVKAFESKKSIPHKVGSSSTNTISADSFSAKGVPLVPSFSNIIPSVPSPTTVINAKSDHKKCLGINDVSLETLFDNTSINSQPPLYNFVRDNNKSKLSSCYDKMKNIKVVKHVHRNAICLKGSEVTINKDKLPVIADITEERFSNEPNITIQETTQVDDNSTTNIDNSSNSQVTSPNSVITLFPSSLNESNNQYQNNDVSFQGINYTSFSNTEDIKAAKRKRSS